jgi:hypothetical protein
MMLLRNLVGFWNISILVEEEGCGIDLVSSAVEVGRSVVGIRSRHGAHIDVST